MNVGLDQISSALGVFMGSEYVNDFDFNNRSYRVYVQADQQDRMLPSDLRKFYVRSGSGQMIPLDNLVTIDQSSGPQVISHYNLFRSAEIDGLPAPGVSIGLGDAERPVIQPSEFLSAIEVRLRQVVGVISVLGRVLVAGRFVRLPQRS